MEHEGSLPNSQEPATCPYSEPKQLRETQGSFIHRCGVWD